jgi:hypothetical protein
VATALALAIPVGVYLLGIFLLHRVLYGERHRLHTLLQVLTVLMLALAPLLAYVGVSAPACLVVVMIAPAISVIGYEAYGYRHVAAALRRAVGS